MSEKTNRGIEKAAVILQENYPVSLAVTVSISGQLEMVYKEPSRHTGRRVLRKALETLLAQLAA